MARVTRSVSLKNATIDVDNMMVMEFDNKGEEFTETSLLSLLREWHGVDGISLTIKKDSTLELAETENEDGELN